MAYFLKKTTLKNRTYLAIYESFYNNDKKGVFCKHKMHSVASYLRIGHLPSFSLYFFLNASANLLLSPGNDIILA